MPLVQHYLYLSWAPSVDKQSCGGPPAGTKCGTTPIFSFPPGWCRQRRGNLLVCWCAHTPSSWGLHKNLRP